MGIGTALLRASRSLATNFAGNSITKPSLASKAIATWRGIKTDANVSSPVHLREYELLLHKSEYFPVSWGAHGSRQTLPSTDVLLRGARFTYPQIIATDFVMRGIPQIDADADSSGKTFNRAQITQAVCKGLGLQVVKRSADCARWVLEHMPWGEKPLGPGALVGVPNDHFAARALDREPIQNMLEKLGYTQQEMLTFNVGLYGAGLNHKDYPADIPLFFLSHWDYKLAGASDSVTMQSSVERKKTVFKSQEQLGGLLDELEHKGKLDYEKAAKLTSLVLDRFGNHTPPINQGFYNELVRDKQDVLAWILTNGQQINHIAVRCANLEEDLKLAKKIIPDGELLPTQHSENGLLSQTAMVAKNFPYQFSNRNIKGVPGAFIEFVQRKNYLGFNFNNAKAIFDHATTVKR